MGRHSTFSQDKADAICAALEKGDTLRKACRDLGLDPATILRWTKDYSEFSKQYADARQVGYQLLADEILEISDDSNGDVIVDDEGNARTDAERVARSRLRVDTRKWMLSKMLPKIYGDKIETTHTGEVTFNKVERVVIDPKN